MPEKRLERTRAVYTEADFEPSWAWPWPKWVFTEVMQMLQDNIHVNVQRRYDDEFK